jgi:hypothetical protein
MPFQVSPGVNVSEIDLTTIVPAVTSTFGATAGVFKWGPIEDRVLVSSEDELVSVFGKPNANNYETFFTAANFLAYGNQLYVTRAAENAYNAVANSGPQPSGANAINIKNVGDFESQYASLGSYAANTYANIYFIAKYAGDLGNSLRVSICSTANSYDTDIPVYTGANADLLSSNTQFKFNLTVGSSSANVFYQNITNANYAVDAAALMKDQFKAGDVLLVGNTSTGTQYLTIDTVGQTVTDTIGSGAFARFNVTFKQSFKQKSDYSVNIIANSSNYTTTFTSRYWEFFNLVDQAPGVSNYVRTRNSNTAVRDEIHVVVVDEKGLFTGIPGQVLEVWNNLSRATDAKSEQGGTIYYRDFINQRSRYIWSSRDIYASTTYTSTDPALGVSSLTSNYSLTFSNGKDGETENSIAVSKLMTAYDKYKSAEDVDVSLILGGKARGNIGETLANYLIDNIAEYRKDCVVFISPDLYDSVNVPGRELDNLVEYRNALTSTSYAVLDSGYKYQYDKYSDIYRWVPLNGDIAGLCVRTDNTRDAWWSPAGFNRGIIKNVVKLAYNPDKADRDVLYRNGINPIVNFPGQGTVLYGDKTLLARPSAFDRINVRRLFIVLEKAIAKAAKSTLFEFNDDFTRASFRNLVTPYLRDVQGRRGIYDFRVVCDTTNNTPEVIDRNEFRGDIYIKPARSINFIQLNFVAVRTGVEFEEIVGKF